MKQKILLLLTILLTSLTASAESFVVDGIKYNNTSSGEDLTCEVTKGDGYSKLTSVTIPNSVTTIGYALFEGCSSLESFTGKFVSEDNRCLIVDGVLKAFAPAELTTYTIPNSVIEIGELAFSSCRSLTSVIIPNSVTLIGYAAFEVCSSLASVEIPNSVIEIGEAAFEVCTSLTSVKIPNSVTTIGEGAFDGCINLTSVEIPNSVTSIESYTFRDCKKLTSVEIPSSVTSIGEDVFYDCI